MSSWGDVDVTQDDCAVRRDEQLGEKTTKCFVATGEQQRSNEASVF